MFDGRDEQFIVERLEREKRCGTVQQLDDFHWQFKADVFDALEILQWVRTFFGRITDFTCTNPVVMERFFGDLEDMADIYRGACK